MTKKTTLESTKRGQERDARNKKAGLERISSSYWVVADEKEDAIARVKKTMGPFCRRAKKALDNK